MSRNLCVVASIALAILSSACATTTTRLAPVDPALVRAEEAMQRELALRTIVEQQTRADSIALRILAAAHPICGQRLAPSMGFRFASVHDYGTEWKEAAIRALSVWDGPTVIAITPGGAADSAGLQPGDRILSVASHAVTPGTRASEQLRTFLGTIPAMAGPLPVTVERSDQRIETTLRPITVCGFDVHVTVAGELNAYADGENIMITSAMMRFADDHEIAVILGHELAHNAMGHMDAMRQNAAAGAFVGFLGDLAMAYAGVNTGGQYTSQGMQLGAMVFSQDFEREADYVGLYALALAGVPLEGTPTFWRHMAIAAPASIGLATSHPTSAERFVRMSATIDEIREKQSAGAPLVPEPEE